MQDADDEQEHYRLRGRLDSGHILRYQGIRQDRKKSGGQLDYRGIPARDITHFLIEHGCHSVEKCRAECEQYPRECTRTGFTAAREKIDDSENLYGGRIERSVERMEHDEQNGVPAQKVGDLIARVALKKRVKPLYIPGFSYNLVNVLMRILPSGAANRLIGVLYAK